MACSPAVFAPRASSTLKHPREAARAQRKGAFVVSALHSSPAQRTSFSLGTRQVHREAAHPRALLASEAPVADGAASVVFHPENVRSVTSATDFEQQFEAARELNQLLVVEFTKESLPNSQKTHQTLVNLSGTTPDVVFLRVFADRSPDLRELFVTNDVKQIPSYVFYRGGEKVHEGTGLQPEKLREQVLYYGQAEYPVRQLETKQDLESLLKEHDGTERLVVVQVTLNFCGPCAKVYPAVLQMSHKMAGSVVFARMFGDANSSTKGLVKELGILEAPTFLFYRDNDLLGRYVGSGKGELIGEVLRYQGVECT